MVFTDGRDNNSTNNAQSIINYSLQQQVPIYIIGVGSSIAESDLRNIANRTGGSYWGINNVGELSRVYTSVYDEGKSTYYIEYQADNSLSQYASRNVQVTIDDGVEYVEIVNDFVPPDPNSVFNDIENPKDIDDGSSSSGNNTSGVFTMDYGTAVNEKYDWDEDNEVTIKLRRPRINGGTFDQMNEINGSIGNAMDDLVSLCEDYIDTSSKCPKTININKSTLKLANNSTIKIEMTGTITFKGSSDTVDVSFLFTHDIGSDDYSFTEQ